MTGCCGKSPSGHRSTEAQVDSSALWEFFPLAGLWAPLSLTGCVVGMAENFVFACGHHWMTHSHPMCTAQFSVAIDLSPATVTTPFQSAVVPSSHYNYLFNYSISLQMG